VGPLVEWHGGQRWYQVDAHDTRTAAGLRAEALAAGGHAVRFRCADPEAGERFAPLSAAVARIHAGLMQSFDPAGVFNRGRMYRAG